MSRSAFSRNRSWRGKDTTRYPPRPLQGESEAGLRLATKACEIRPDLRVLYTTGQGITDGMLAMFVKNSAFLPKPYTVDQLTATLRLKFGFRQGQSK